MNEKKPIDIRKSVCEICREHPEVKAILAGLGFTDITKPGMLQTAGRFMTIPAGARMKGMDLNRIKEALRERGFEPVEDEAQ